MLALPLHQNQLRRPDQLRQLLLQCGVEGVLDLRETLLLHLQRHVVLKVPPRIRVLSHAEQVHERVIEAHLLHQRHGRGVLLWCLPTEPRDHIRADRTLRQRRADLLHEAEERIPRVGAIHALKTAVASALNGEVNGATDVGVRFDHFQHGQGEVLCVNAPDVKCLGVW